MRALRTAVSVVVLLFTTLSISEGKTSYAYVANATGTTVSVINTSTNAVVKTITVGSNPFPVVVDPAGKNVYIGNQSSNSVSVISTSTNAVVGTIPVGRVSRWTRNQPQRKNPVRGQ